MNQKSMATGVLALASALSLAGCSRGPDDAQAVAWIQEHTKAQGAYSVPRNIQRINGWKQGEEGYVVEYGYELAATCHYAECVLKALAEAEKDPAVYDPEGLKGLKYGAVYTALLSSEKELDGFSSTLLEDIKDSQDGTKLLDIGRRVRTQQLDKALLAYLSGPDAKTIQKKQRALIWAMSSVESAGITPGATAGAITTAGMNWKASFRKTENGWQLIQ